LADRRALLDLGTRNRLINIPLRTKNIRAIEIVDCKSAEVFDLLGQAKRCTFIPTEEDKPASAADGSTETSAHQPKEVNGGSRSRQAETKLQTRLSSEGLQKRLLDIWYDAKTLEEEQGVNILYLAFGLLKWFEDDKSDTERFAPLVLLPARLERSSAADRFHLVSRSEPPSPNLSLQAKMDAEFGLKIEDFGDEDDVDIAAYLSGIAETVSRKSRWEVRPDAMVLGFFSFSKFLMYRDLDPENLAGRREPRPACPHSGPAAGRLRSTRADRFRRWQYRRGNSAGGDQPRRRRRLISDRCDRRSCARTASRHQRATRHRQIADDYEHHRVGGRSGPNGAFRR
jgi:hypothetical protein